MKKSITSLALVLLTMSGNAQDSLQTSGAKNHLNELGLDATPFIKFYSTFSDRGLYYQPNYIVTYRRYFRNSNFRSAIGGNYSFTESPSPYIPDSLNKKYYNRSKYIILRVGYEFYQSLSRRWQVYYGADLVGSYAESKNDDNYSNGGYVVGTESKAKNIGVAPVLGLRFRINKRISLITESSLLIQYSESSSYQFYSPATSAYPPIPNDRKQSGIALGTSFNYPLALILTISI
jgi:hypothetical protein